MTTITFDVSAFRTLFPQFASPTPFPDALLQGYWNIAILYISNQDGYGWMQGTVRTQALNLLTAHIAALALILNQGQTPGLVTASTIDKISVTLEPPPTKTSFQWWLNLTGYGQQLRALLSVSAAGGWFIGGSSDILAIRRVGC